MADTTNTNVTEVDQYTKLDVPHKIGYAVGDFACNMSWSLISSYLVYFMTDVALIPAGLVSIVMLASKAWDAINDPMVGYWADHTKSKWGRYRPWVLFAAVPMLIFNVMCFTTFPNATQNFRTWWAFIAYFVLVLLYTMVNVTYSAMPASLTRDAETRTSLASYRMTGAFLAMTLLSFFMLRMVNYYGGGAHGYQMASLTFSVLACPFFFIVVASTKEVVEAPIEHVKFKESFKAAFQNRPMIHIMFAYLVWGVVFGGNAIRVYYCTYCFGDELLYANSATIQSIFGMIGTFSCTYLVKKVKNKGTLAATAATIIAIDSIITYFIPWNAVGLYMFLNVFYGFGSGMFLASIFGMQPDCAEYTQYYSNGLYMPGFLSTIINFALKFGSAVAVSGATALLGVFGYVPKAAQTQSTLTAMNFMSNMFVGIMMVLAAIAMFTYKLDKKTHAWLTDEVQNGRFAEPGAKRVC